MSSILEAVLLKNGPAEAALEVKGVIYLFSLFFSRYSRSGLVNIGPRILLKVSTLRL